MCLVVAVFFFVQVSFIKVAIFVYPGRRLSEAEFNALKLRTYW